MEDNLIKPDIVLVTKNVMVPLALPASRNKLLVSTLVSKKKTKIVKTRRNKAPVRQNLPFSQDKDCEQERSKDTTKKTSRSDDTCNDYNYDSLLNFRSESEENYANSYNREYGLFRDLSGEAKIEQQTSSLSFPAVNAPKEISKLSCETILSPKFPRSFVSDLKDCELEENLTDEESLFDRSEEKENNWLRRDEEELEIFNECESRDGSITKIRSCASSDVNSKVCNAFESQPVETLESERCKIKYSWEDLDNWIPPSEKKKILRSNEKKSEETIKKSHECGIKYSWQIVGMGVQTSEILIKNHASKDDETMEICNYPCTIKYSWQIIGTGTQVSFRENTRDPSKYVKDYWDGKILRTMKRSLDQTRRVERSGKIKILYSEKTQTMADKVHQTDITDCRVKYSWQNLTKPYLVTTENP